MHWAQKKAIELPDSATFTEKLDAWPTADMGARRPLATLRRKYRAGVMKLSFFYMLRKWEWLKVVKKEPRCRMSTTKSIVLLYWIFFILVISFQQRKKIYPEALKSTASPKIFEHGRVVFHPSNFLSLSQHFQIYECSQNGKLCLLCC